jgi:hypothetical protein
MSASDAHESQQPLFGLTPEVVLVSLGALAVVLGIVLLVVDSPWFGGALLVAGALLLGAAIGSAARSDEARATRDRASAALAERRDLRRLEQERKALAAGRPARVAALGEAVYSGDDVGAASLRAELEDLDRSITAKDAEMTAVHERAEARRDRERLERAQTAVIETVEAPAPPADELPQPPLEPEPQPPVEPEPQPPVIPEPTPVPHEPPTPPEIPEPTPVPHEPPEPSAAPEEQPEPTAEAPTEVTPPEEPVDPDGPTDEENRPLGRRRGR